MNNNYNDILVRAFSKTTEQNRITNNSILFVTDTANNFYDT